MSPPTADPTALARDLLRCPSVTPAEAGALALIERMLKPVGFAVHRVTFAEPGTGPLDDLAYRLWVLRRDALREAAKAHRRDLAHGGDNLAAR